MSEIKRNKLLIFCYAVIVIEALLFGISMIIGLERGSSFGNVLGVGAFAASVALVYIVSYPDIKGKNLQSNQNIDTTASQPNQENLIKNSQTSQNGIILIVLGVISFV